MEHLILYKVINNEQTHLWPLMLLCYECILLSCQRPEHTAFSALKPDVAMYYHQSFRAAGRDSVGWCGCGAKV